MNGSVKTFDARVSALGELDSQSAAALVHAAADLALILDDAGVVRDIAIASGGAESPAVDVREWLGHPWVETAAPETREKIREMLREAQATGVSSRRQVNHVTSAGVELPVAYTALRLGDGANFLVVGRDLRGMSALQQRLVEAQQAMERDYWRMRHIETRYRLLFQLTAEAVLVVDTASLKVVDANPAAGRLFALPPKRLVGRTFPLDVDRIGEQALQELLASVRGSGRSEEGRVKLLSHERSLRVGVSLVRQDGASLFLVRLMPESGGADTSSDDGRALEVVRDMPDAFVVTDMEGRILAANRGFLDLAQLASEEQARGQSVSRWMGRPGADLPVLLTTLREHGVARLFATGVRGEYGSSAEVEVSAVVAPAGAESCIGLVIRDVGRRLASGPQGARDLTRAVEQLTGLVGRVALRDLVRDTVDLVERHFIEAALELTGSNRTSAAEVLGVSRQSLYVKMRRYQLGGADSQRSDPDA